MENKKRIFVTSVLTDNMLRNAKTREYEIKCSGSSLEEIRTVLDQGEKVTFALRNGALVGTLRKKGIPAEINPIEITLEKGDILFVLDPGGRIHDLIYENELPDYMTITVGKYEIINK